MTQLASQFQVYALDTPGYGNSSPIEKTDPTIADFAAALDETLTTLGLGSVPLYARHTSAKIALEYAARTSSPPRLLILDGLAIRSRQPDEEFIQTYMHHYPIDSNGTFLAFEWSRIRDVMRWFPWFDRRDQTRVRSDFPLARLARTLGTRRAFRRAKLFERIYRCGRRPGQSTTFLKPLTTMSRSSLVSSAIANGRCLPRLRTR